MTNQAGNQFPKRNDPFCGLCMASMLTQRSALRKTRMCLDWESEQETIEHSTFFTACSWRASTEPFLEDRYRPWPLEVIKRLLFSLSSTACWCPDILGWCWPALRGDLASRRRCGPGRCSTVWPATSSGSSRAPYWLWPSSPWSWRGWRRIGSRSLPTCWGKHR